MTDIVLDGAALEKVGQADPATGPLRNRDARGPIPHVSRLNTRHRPGIVYAKPVLMLRDLKLALRAFRKRRGYAATVALTLALGVGASTSIFAFVDAALLQPPPFPQPERLGVIWGVAGPERDIRGASFLEIKDWKARTRSFDDVVLYDEVSLNMSIDGADAARVDGEMVGHGFFALLGGTTSLGRAFTLEEDAAPGQHPVAVISDALWRRSFAASPDLASRRVLLNDQPVAIIGVMAPGFAGLSLDTDIWVPSMMIGLTSSASILESRGSRWLAALGRLKEGVTADAAQADLDAAAASLASEFPDSNTDRGALLQPLEQFYLGDTAGTLRLLFGAVLLLLLVACSNVAALQLARSTSRQHEISVSLALGATRKHVARQLAAEGIVLGAAGALLGIIAASWMLRGIAAMQPDGALPAFVEPALGMRALFFASAAALVSAMLTTVLPALTMADTSVMLALRGSTRAVRGGLGSIARPAPQQLLVVAQVAVALALLLGAGVVTSTLREQLRVPLGFEPARVATAQVRLTGERYTPEARVAFGQRLEDALRALPGAEQATVTDGLPFSGSNASILVREPDLADRVRYYRHAVSPSFFDTLGARFVDGRGFTGYERVDTSGVAVVSESGARRLFPDGNAVGRKFRMGGATAEEVEIIGVVSDIRYRDLTADLGAARAEPDVFFSLAQLPSRGLQFAVQTSGAAPSVRMLQEAVSSVDPALPVYGAQPLSLAASLQTANARFTSAIMGGFSAATLLLAGIGLYGLVSYVVGLSRREIALRLALGARRAELVRSVIVKGMSLVAAGVAGGLLLAWSLRGVWADWTSATPSLEPWTAAWAIGTLMLAGVVASIVPAISAASVHPNLALRGD